MIHNFYENLLLETEWKLLTEHSRKVKQADTCGRKDKEEEKNGHLLTGCRNEGHSWNLWHKNKHSDANSICNF